MWQLIETYTGEWPEKVDLWLNVPASPRSMGWSDAFRVVECWREDSKWFHIDRSEKAELYGPYITHWMPMPAPPESDL